MRVVLQVVEGPGRGRRMLLRAMHELRVGRTELAEFVCGDDPKMSRVHFKLQTDEVGCYVQDLGSSNGTFVNDERIETTRLNHGDRLQAGLTTFMIQIEGDQPSETGSISTELLAARPAASVPRGKFEFEPCRCFSGLWRYRFNAAGVAPADLAQKLCNTWPLYIIADLKRMAGDAPEEIRNPQALLEHLGEEIAAEYPVWFAADDCPQWPALVAAEAGRNALILLYSRQPRDTLWEHLQTVVRGRVPGVAPSDGLLGVCWPGVLHLLLGSGESALVDRIFAGLDAVQLVPPQDPEQVYVYGPESLGQVLEECGYKRLPEVNVPVAPSEAEDETAPEKESNP